MIFQRREFVLANRNRLTATYCAGTAYVGDREACQRRTAERVTPHGLKLGVRNGEREGERERERERATARGQKSTIVTPVS